MINLEIEKELTLSAQERYDIIAMAMDAADDNGFINCFIFERALFVYAAVYLYPEHQALISQAAAENLIKTWEELIADGLLENLAKDYADDVKQLATEGQKWYDEYAQWAHSARGILEVVQQYTGNIVGNAASRLTQTAQEDGLKSAPAPKENVIDAESLFV